jgi:hypothetical protein
MVFRKRSFEARTNDIFVSDRKWRVRVGAVAELDFANILKWTTENFGARQSRSPSVADFRTDGGTVEEKLARAGVVPLLHISVLRRDVKLAQPTL